MMVDEALLRGNLSFSLCIALTCSVDGGMASENYGNYSETCPSSRNEAASHPCNEPQTDLCPCKALVNDGAERGTARCGSADFRALPNSEQERRHYPQYHFPLVLAPWFFIAEDELCRVSSISIRHTRLGHILNRLAKSGRCLRVVGSMVPDGVYIYRYDGACDRNLLGQNVLC